MRDGDSQRPAQPKSKSAAAGHACACEIQAPLPCPSLPRCSPLTPCPSLPHCSPPTPAPHSTMPMLRPCAHLCPHPVPCTPVPHPVPDHLQCSDHAVEALPQGWAQVSEYQCAAQETLGATADLNQGNAGGKLEKLPEISCLGPLIMADEALVALRESCPARRASSLMQIRGQPDPGQWLCPGLGQDRVTVNSLVPASCWAGGTWQPGPCMAWTAPCTQHLRATQRGADWMVG